MVWVWLVPPSVTPIIRTCALLVVLGEVFRPKPSLCIFFKKHLINASPDHQKCTRPDNRCHTKWYGWYHPVDTHYPDVCTSGGIRRGISSKTVFMHFFKKHLMNASPDHQKCTRPDNRCHTKWYGWYHPVDTHYPDVCTSGGIRRGISSKTVFMHFFKKHLMNASPDHQTYTRPDNRCHTEWYG